MSSKTMLMKVNKTNYHKCFLALSNNNLKTENKRKEHRKRSDNAFLGLSKPEQKHSSLKTRFQKKNNFSNHSESCFQQIKWNEL